MRFKEDRLLKGMFPNILGLFAKSRQSNVSVSDGLDFL